MCIFDPIKYLYYTNQIIECFFLIQVYILIIWILYTE